ncbi:acetyltransferase [Candidatus Poribacteria bacterium]
MKVVIFGTGEFAQLAHVYLTKDSPYEVAAFTVNEDYIKEKELFGLPIVPFEEIEKHYPCDEFKMFIAVGYSNTNKVRAEKYYEAKDKGYELISYINSKVVLWEVAEIGDNCFIAENLTILPFVKIGNNVVIWSGSLIAHHSVIGDHCFVSAHVAVAGNVRVEPYCFLGINSTIRDGITIARECVIGMGAVIARDTQEKGVYIAKPAALYPYDSSKIRI